MEAQSYYVRFGLQYFIILGLILFFTNFVLPLLFPVISNNLEQVNDILIILATPILAMVLFNKYIYKIKTDYKNNMLDHIIAEIQLLRNNREDRLNSSQIIDLLERLKVSK